MKFRSFTEFIKGLSFRAFRPAVYAWFFNLVFSLFVYWGYYKLLVNAAGHSVIAADTSEIGVFTLLGDISLNHDGSLSLVSYIAMLAAFLYFLLSIFLAGGIYSTMVGRERTTFGNLLASSIENFPGMFKLFLLNVLNILVAVLILGIPLAVFIANESLSQSEGAIQVFTYGWTALAALIMTFVIAIYDFSRVFKLKEERGIFNAFKKGFGFTFSNKLNVLVLFLLYGISTFIIYLIFTVFSGLTRDMAYITVLFVFCQIFVLARYYIKIAVMQAEVSITEH